MFFEILISIFNHVAILVNNTGCTRQPVLSFLLNFNYLQIYNWHSAFLLICIQYHFIDVNQYIFCDIVKLKLIEWVLCIPRLIYQTITLYNT